MKGLLFGNRWEPRVRPTYEALNPPRKTKPAPPSQQLHVIKSDDLISGRGMLMLAVVELIVFFWPSIFSNSLD
ncbi:Uncharacterized protein TCM_037106 [Theobroma cacao]|uniref:Uncharacterized protein n=1 Tax=Theobroma cacao TaxID=3641 RepID=A0A061GKD9_THECC|nr:Uncharacterized protein TCM_037106 [Theobroma cacao]